MKGFDEQPAGTYPESALTARLFRRVSEPLGVIDVRHPEELHARSTAFVGRRLELLNTWKTRYGLTNPEAPGERGGGHPLRNFVSSAGRESVSVASTQPRVMRSALPGADVSFKGPLVEVAERYRVRRAGERMASEGSGGRGFGGSVPGAVELVVRAAELPMQGAGAPALELQRVGVTARPGDDVESSTAAPSIPPAASPMTLVTPVIVPQVSRVRREAGEMVLRRKVVEESAAATGSGVPVARSVTVAQSLPVSQSLTVSQVGGELPLVREIRNGGSASAVEPLVARKEIPVATSPPSKIAPEIPIRLNVPNAAPIVWRRADPRAAEQSSRAMAPPVSTGASPQIMRAPPVTSGPPVHLSSGGGIDVEHLAQRVSRVIARELDVQRERRGISR